MAANPNTSGIFANTEFQGAITPSVAVQNPVQNNGLSDFFNSVDNGIQNAGQLFKAGAKNANNQVLAKFQNDVGSITNAMEQGMSVQEGRMRLRALNSQYVANYPNMVKDLDELQGKLVSTVGLANVISTGSEDVQRQKKIADDASAAGWPDTQSYMAHQQSVNQLAITKTQLDQQIAQYGLVTQNDKAHAYGALKSVIQTGLPWVNGKISDYQNQIDSGQTTPDQAIADLTAEVSKETAFIGQARGLSGGADKDADPSFLLTGIQDRLKAFTDYNSGAISKQVYQDKLASSTAQDQLSLRQADPQLAKLAALSQMLGPVAAAPIVQRLTDHGLNIVTQLEQEPGLDPNTGVSTTGKKPVDLVGSDPDINSSLAVASASIKKMGANPTPEQQKAIGNTITNVFSSIKTFGGTANHPQDLNSVMDFLGDPAVNAWAVKNGGVPKGAGDAASYVVQQQYGEVLLPLIRQRWDAATAPISNTSTNKSPMASAVEQANVAGVIQPVWNGAGVEFRPSPGFEKNSGAVALANSLNKGPDAIAGPLNLYIRAMSTLQGSSDYQGFYKKNIFDRLFSPTNPNPNSKVPAGEKVSDLANGFADNGNSEKVASATTATTFGDAKDLTAGMRNNNPGNIKYSSANNWQGQVGPSKNTDQGDPQVVFNSTQAGMRAAAKLVLSKYHTGADTIRQLIAGKGGWTPGYIPGAEGVAKAAGVGLDEPLNMNDPVILAKVMRGIVTQEHGPASKKYTDDMIRQGVQSALS